MAHVIGRDVRFFDYSYYGSGIPGDELTVAFAENALSVMESLGATIVDVDTGDVFAYNGDEFTALLYEFRAQIADYLATLTHTNMRTLADLIAFNDAHCTQEMPYYGQEVFLLAEMFPGYPNDPAYIAARTHARTAARSGIDNVINSGVDAIVAPHSNELDRARCGGLSKLVAARRHSRQWKTGGNAHVQHLPA